MSHLLPLRPRGICLTLAVSGCVLGGSLHAADPPKPVKPPPPPAYLTPAEAGDDYRLQGEYRGWQRALGSERASEAIGLQIIALGDGQFVATKYYGGLPGAGWAGGPRYEYQGERDGDIVRVHTQDYVIEADGNQALIFAPDGRRAGELQRIERVSPTLNAPPPPGAIVLFSGPETDAFVSPKVTEEGWLREGTQTKDAYGDFRLHGEFRLPFKPLGRGQDRGNSGFYLQSRYEVQVLDSFGLKGIENECGAIYTKKRPDVNMCLPPLAWQTYDMDFTAPKFDAQGKKVSDMRISVWHNGVLIHNNVAIPAKTGGGAQEGPNPLPTKLQDHANPVVYRNIWLLPKSSGTASADWLKLPLSGPPTPLVSYSPPDVIAVSPRGVVTLGP